MVSELFDWEELEGRNTSGRTNVPNKVVSKIDASKLMLVKQIVFFTTFHVIRQLNVKGSGRFVARLLIRMCEKNQMHVRRSSMHNNVYHSNLGSTK